MAAGPRASNRSAGLPQTKLHTLIYDNLIATQITFPVSGFLRRMPFMTRSVCFAVTCLTPETNIQYILLKKAGKTQTPNNHLHFN